MFQIKICGVTSSADARAVAEAGADCIGLNFFPGSARYLPPEHAEEIVAAMPDGLVKVGVFVNSPLGEIREIAGRLSLDLVQLHGDEPPELIAQLAGRPVIKAFRLGREGLAPVGQYLEACYQLAALPAMILLDAYQADAYGGTGKTIDWAAAREYHDLGAGPALILAGGLTPANVAAAIQAVRPSAVDTASGVEASPGHKDRAKLRAFVAAAQAGFAEGLRGGERATGEG